MSTTAVVMVTVGLLVASAFFVMVEFALLGVKRHRLEERASSSAIARAALRGVDELTVMLAAAQLGITACTFALGAVTKPAVSAWIMPGIEMTGLPEAAAYPVSFLLALLVVTFLHLVVGEMAPKSWAIAFPERAALVIAVPARMVAWVLRPLLLGMNRAANRLVRWSGVDPVDRAAAGGHDAATLRHLVEHSADAGVLDQEARDRIVGALDLSRHSLADLPGTEVPTVPAGATVGEVQDAARASGQMRILVRGVGGDPGGGGRTAVIHVRDTLTLPREDGVLGITRPLRVLAPELPVHEALRQMRDAGEQLIGVGVHEGGSTSIARIITLPEILAFVLPSSTRI